MASEPSFVFGESSIKDFFVLKPVRQQRSEKYGLTFSCFECRLKHLNSIPFEQIPEVVTLILEAVFEEILGDASDSDKVRIRLNSSSLKQPIWTPPITKSELTVARLMTAVENVLQSHEEFRLDDSFEIWAQVAKVPAGSGRQDIPKLLLQKLTQKQCVVQVRNDDFACLPRALMIGKASKLADNDIKTFKNLYNVRKPTTFSDRTLQTRLARQLITDSHLELRQYSLDDLAAFQNALADYQIIVVSVEHLNSVVFAGAVKDKKIVLLHHSNHFDVLTSLPAWFGRNHWCYHCNKGFDHRESHRCKHVCKCCLRQSCSETLEPSVYCADCNRTFRGSDCFAAHKKVRKQGNQRTGANDSDTDDESDLSHERESQSGSEADESDAEQTPEDGLEKKSSRCRRSICSSFFVCHLCHRFISKLKRKTDHQCGEVWCSVCHLYFQAGEHVCYMPPVVITETELKKHSNAKFLYFDLECFQDENGIFVPNVAVVQDEEGNEVRFPADLTDLGEDVTDEFCSYIFDARFKNYFVIAHNFRGFDSYPILRWLLNNGITPKIIMSGSKIMQLDVKEYNIRFRDSYNYNPQSLSSWAKTFDLAKNEQKGSFPHEYNSPEHWGKEVQYPNKTAYGYNNMKKAERKAFMKFYRKDRRKKKNLFNVDAELLRYCSQDVTTLRLCSRKLRQIFLELSGGLCPFVSALTIAGLCSFFWRAKLLEPNLIELLKPSQRTSSVKATKWLNHLGETEELSLETEVRVSNYFVDAICHQNKTIFEFYGKYPSLVIHGS